MTPPLKAAFIEEMHMAKFAYQETRFDRAFTHLERAHILGQTLRLTAVVPGFLFGWVPKGNTGGADVSATKPMPIPDELTGLLENNDVWRDVCKRAAVWVLLILGAVLLFNL